VFQRRTLMTRGVGRTSPNPSAVLGRTRVPSHDGGTVPSAAGCGEGEPAGGLGEGPVVVGPGCGLVTDGVAGGAAGGLVGGVTDGAADDVGGAAGWAARCAAPHAVRALASATPTSVSRTRRPTTSTLAVEVSPRACL
jgi:hypothetical protein